MSSRAAPAAPPDFASAPNGAIAYHHLAQSPLWRAPARPPTPEDGYKIAYHPPLPSAVLEVVDSDTGEVVDHGETGRVRLTALTREFFVPGFLERDEGEREPPWGPYAWDGVSGVRPFGKLSGGTTVGVY